MTYNVFSGTLNPTQSLTLHLIYLLLREKLRSVLNFGQNDSWKLLEIVPADLLDTLAMFPTAVQHVALLLTHGLFVTAIFFVLYVLDSGHSCTCCIWCYAGVVGGCEWTSLSISRTAV